MIKMMLVSMSLSLSLISVASADDLATNIQNAFSKSNGKCKVTSIKNEFISILCAKSNLYGSYKVAVENNIISGTGSTWTSDGEEAECTVNGKIKEDDKIKITLQCF